jgi:hypothetical protein
MITTTARTRDTPLKQPSTPHLQQLGLVDQQVELLATVQHFFNVLNHDVLDLVFFQCDSGSVVQERQRSGE